MLSVLTESPAGDNFFSQENTTWREGKRATYVMMEGEQTLGGEIEMMYHRTINLECI